MKVIIPRSTKAACVGSIGNTTVQEVVSHQDEPLTLVFLNAAGNAAPLAEGGTITVKVKASRTAAELIASATSFTADAAGHNGWLSFNTAEANALSPAAEVWLEVSWLENGHYEIAEAVKIRIVHPFGADSDVQPTAGDTAARLAFLTQYIVAADASVVITPDETLGRILVSSTAQGGGLTLVAGPANSGTILVKDGDTTLGSFFINS